MASRAEPSVQKTLHLRLSSGFKNLERAVEEAEAFMATVTDDDDLTYRVTLLTSETVTNAIEHGHRWNPEQPLIPDPPAYPAPRLARRHPFLALPIRVGGPAAEQGDGPADRGEDSEFEDAR